MGCPALRSEAFQASKLLLVPRCVHRAMTLLVMLTFLFSAAVNSIQETKHFAFDEFNQCNTLFLALPSAARCSSMFAFQVNIATAMVRF